jgi:hypothetical protein
MHRAEKRCAKAKGAVDANGIPKPHARGLGMPAFRLAVALSCEASRGAAVRSAEARCD